MRIAPETKWLIVSSRLANHEGRCVTQAGGSSPSRSLDFFSRSVRPGSAEPRPRSYTALHGRTLHPRAPMIGMNGEQIETRLAKAAAGVREHEIVNLRCR